MIGILYWSHFFVAILTLGRNLKSVGSNPPHTYLTHTASNNTVASGVSGSIRGRQSDYIKAILLGKIPVELNFN